MSCLVDTGSMVTTVTESCFTTYFKPWGPERLLSCQWLQLRAVNGLSIPYIGYLELDIELELSLSSPALVKVVQGTVYIPVVNVGTTDIVWTW